MMGWWSRAGLRGRVLIILVAVVALLIIAGPAVSACYQGSSGVTMSGEE